MRGSLSLIYAVVIASAIAWRSWTPIFLFVLPQFFGTWLMIVHNTLQHAGLAENVLDHRLNCRTVYMNPISRFIYWNMNYHLEHHLFPLVPYHALPRLHAAVKDDCPAPYPSILAAWRELLPAILRQVKDPDYHVQRPLPPPRTRAVEGTYGSAAAPDAEGWIEVCADADLAQVGRGPLRLRQKNLCRLPRRPRLDLRHRRRLHPWEHASRRRSGPRGHDRVSQAQRAVPAGGWLSGACAGLPRAGDVSRRKPPRKTAAEPASRRRRRRPYTKDAEPARRQQPLRGHVHQGARFRADGQGRLLARRLPAVRHPGL